jgi:hypothetical protein
MEEAKIKFLRLHQKCMIIMMTHEHHLKTPQTQTRLMID